MDYKTLATAPISAEEPAGTDVKYDEDFEKIEAEVAKLSSPTESGTLDWALVVKLSEEILAHKSKNLLVAVYLSYALLKQRGIPGLIDGIQVIAEMLETYWETLYPPLRRIKGRMNAIEWLLDKVSKELEKAPAIVVEQAQKDAFMADLKKIDDFLNDKVEDAPLFYNLIQLADMKLTSAEVPSAPPEPQEAQERPQETQPESQELPTPTEDAQEERANVTPSAAAVKASPHPSAQSDDDAQHTFESMVNDLNILTGEMIAAQDYRSELFMINRAFAWLDIETLPASEEQVTMLPPPDTQERELLQKLFDAHDYSALLWAAESRITTYLFWLDLHYYVADALRSLGFTQASDVVLQQTRYFVEKLPGVQRLTFSDKTPFADERTKAWLRSTAQTTETEMHTHTVTAQEEVPCDAPGIDRLSYLIAHSESVEQEVLYNIALCHCLAATADPILITTYTKSLLRRIDTYKTQQWNPQVALDAYTAALACYQSLETPPDAELETLYEKIALLKPSLLKEI